MRSFRPREFVPFRCLVVFLVALTGCAADSISPSSETQSPTRSVVETEPSPSEEKVQFAVIGDFGTGDANANAVADAVRNWMSGAQADALVTTGDNVYPDGDPQRFDAAWREPYGWVQRSTAALIASLGNHDVLTAEGTEVMELLDMPGPWYSRKLGPVRFFVIDANRPDDPEQLAWLERALTRSQATWEIAVFHQPVFSCAIHRNTSRVQASLLPVIREEDVDLVLNGHDHNYQRFGSRPGNTYVVTGGGGATLYRMHQCPPGTPPPTVSDTEHHHFVAIEVAAQRLHLKAIATDGSVIDEITLVDRET